MGVGLYAGWLFVCFLWTKGLVQKPVTMKCVQCTVTSLLRDQRTCVVYEVACG